MAGAGGQGTAKVALYTVSSDSHTHRGSCINSVFRSRMVVVSATCINSIICRVVVSATCISNVFCRVMVQVLVASAACINNVFCGVVVLEEAVCAPFINRHLSREEVLATEFVKKFCINGFQCELDGDI